MYPCSSEFDKRHINWNQSFPINPHLLKRWIVEDIGRAPIIYQDSVGIVVPYPNANHKRIVMRVVEAPDIFLCKPNDRVVNLCHLQEESCQRDILDHP